VELSWLNVETKKKKRERTKQATNNQNKTKQETPSKSFDSNMEETYFKALLRVSGIRDDWQKKSGIRDNWQNNYRDEG